MQLPACVFAIIYFRCFSASFKFSQRKKLGKHRKLRERDDGFRSVWFGRESELHVSGLAWEWRTEERRILLVSPGTFLNNAHWLGASAVGTFSPRRFI